MHNTYVCWFSIRDGGDVCDVLVGMKLFLRKAKEVFPKTGGRFVVYPFNRRPGRCVYNVGFVCAPSAVMGIKHTMYVIL